MRIKEVSVTNLFGTFHHVIPLNLEDHITIIHGPNGFGKTCLLKLIYALLNSRYSELRKIPFEEFYIGFDDNSTIQVSKALDSSNKTNKLKIDFHKPGAKTQSFSPFSSNDERREIPFNVIDRIENIPDLYRVGPETWMYASTGEQLSIEDVLERFDYAFPSQIKARREPTWLKELISCVHIRIIEAQRLLTFSSPNRSYSASRMSMVSSVATYSEEIAKNIKAKLAEYAELSQSLDRTFPARLVRQKAPLDLTDDEVRKKLIELEKKRFRLIEAGLLEKDEDQDFQVQQNVDESTKNILSVYVEDVEKKLKVFDEVANKIDLLKRIINQRFQYKQLVISKDKGFILTTYDGKLLSPTDLSSGEQHELVLLYELLFKVKPNSLILIDEPELSLHVAWQVQFLDDLQEVTKLSNFDILLATHSPDIINERWDLTIELKGPEECGNT